FVLTDEASRKTVEQRQSAGLQIRRRTAKTDDIGEEHRVLCDARREKEVCRGKLVCMTIRIRLFPLGLEDRLGRNRRAHTDLNAIFGLVLQSTLNFFVYRLPPVHPLSLIRRRFLSAR